MIVVDASVMAAALMGDDGAIDRLDGETLAAPYLLEAEVGSVFRRHVMCGNIASSAAEGALEDLEALTVLLYGHSLFMARAWELRHNLSFYDGLYVALAEWQEVPLLTADARLANAPGVGAEVEVLT